jgi:hypothetical protein
MRELARATVNRLMLKRVEAVTPWASELRLAQRHYSSL